MISKVSVKKLVEFSRFSEKKQRNFAHQLQVPKAPIPETEGGGDYWKRSLSALSNAFKYGDNKLIREKIELVSPLYEAADDDRIRKMYQRNLDILHNYEDFNFSSLRPSADLKFLKKSQLPFTVKGIPIHVAPHHIFSYGDEEQANLGGVWFVAWLDRYDLGDLGIFSESLFRYLSDIFSNHYKIDPNHCLTVDALSMQSVTYKQILEGDIPSLLETSADKLNNYLKK